MHTRVTEGDSLQVSQEIDSLWRCRTEVCFPTGVSEFFSSSHDQISNRLLGHLSWLQRRL